MEKPLQLRIGSFAGFFALSAHQKCLNVENLSPTSRQFYGFSADFSPQNPPLFSVIYLYNTQFTCKKIYFFAENFGKTAEIATFA
ncbi:MAG: hypothetical protein E7483_06485 [Ruminococcaceae bacterium]|nr:hypothetical protein [Oscillospiraceae bacterium]